MPRLSLIIAVLHTVMAAVAIGHALLHKRHSRAALGWVISIALYPVVGPVAYGIFGINRVRTLSRKLRDEVHGKLAFHGVRRRLLADAGRSDPAWIGEEERHLLAVGETLTASPLCVGNDVRLLRNGDEAFPSMLEAIEGAQHRVWLCTYIFETNAMGRRFIDALADAHDRGVDVRVIVDGVGVLYSWPRATRLLRKRGVAVRRFLPPRLIPPQLYVNLRTHRKLLCVDSQFAFAGGMNIGGRHMVLAPETDGPTQDAHMRFEGPIAVDLERLFAHDWGFTRRKRQPYTTAIPPEELAARWGSDRGACRVIPDGPDHHLDKLEALFVALTSAARERVTIVTPYFLPSEALTGALIAAALRGIDVRVILPERSNLPFVQAATRRILPGLLRYGVEVLHQPEPFAHTKLFAVDGRYNLVGSANIDARSLRLNFEVGVEVVDDAFAAEVRAYIDDLLARSRVLTIEEANDRSLPRRLVDSLCWLASPYL